MSFQIPTLKSTKSLFVINKDFYAKKDTGEVRVTVECLVPAGGTRPNKKGYSVAAFTAEKEVYDALNLDNGPIMVNFESEPRESRNGFGNTTNTDHLLRVIADKSAAAPAAQPQQK
ncbi:hypothetical protein GCM10007421_22400 [Halopseudomonas oceani]|uniref:Single-stranded DNA-binding protein n=1 Tax=Halopseudomonas oceani TaxID=1708783 RepID=A0A2P4ET10_9GAMM|nr:hypothetical protein [Halopseudomonas oceani]POB02419.1 hypothetical protein C1949_13310 [Halopseudomonas oceani]GGE47654.1 hypothetical protein GCM10007421_22400 [Halopseudomonas oceani]